MAKTPEKSTVDAQIDLVSALIQAINATKPVEKERLHKPRNAWSPKDGKAKLKLKRKMYQHSLLMDEDLLTNEQIELLNQLRPGSYLDGWVKVTRRKDKGVDITYPIKSQSNRMQLASRFGITSLDSLLQRCIDEGNAGKAVEE